MYVVEAERGAEVVSPGVVYVIVVDWAWTMDINAAAASKAVTLKRCIERERAARWRDTIWQFDVKP